MEKNTNTTNNTMPISREELAAFNLVQQTVIKEVINTLVESFKNEILAMNANINNHFDQVLIALNEQNQNMVDVVKGLTNSQLATAKAIKESGETSRKQIYAISQRMFGDNKAVKSNTIFNSSMTPVEQSRWTKKVWGELSKLCETSGLAECTLLSEIYNEMLRSGYNTKSLFEEYKKQNPSVEKRIEMFSKSDVLMKSFGDGFNAIWRKYKNNKLTSDAPEMNTPSQLNANSPANNIDEIRKAVAGLSRSGKPKGQTYNKAFRIVDNKYGISIRDEAAKIIKANNMNKYTTVISAVSKDSNLSKILCDAIYESLGK